MPATAALSFTGNSMFLPVCIRRLGIRPGVAASFRELSPPIGESLASLLFILKLLSRTATERSAQTGLLFPPPPQFPE